MKRTICAAVAALMISTLIFGGCGGENKNSSAAESADTSTVSPATQDEPTAETAVSTGKKVQISDDELGDIWITEQAGVKLNTLNNEGFSDEGGFKTYSENGSPASITGIDISSYSGDVDWERVKAAGVEFVMVRIGGRGYGDEGAMYADDRAVEYIKGAQAAGIKAGGYFFSQAITAKEAEEEVSFIKQTLGDITPDYPIAYDLEVIKEESARTDNLTPDQATECAKAFCEAVKNLGYKPMIYTAARELYFRYDLTKLADYDIWYSEYSDVPGSHYRFSMWQYSDTAAVDGIEGNVDLNLCFTNIAGY